MDRDIGKCSNIGKFLNVFLEEISVRLDNKIFIEMLSLTAEVIKYNQLNNNSITGNQPDSYSIINSHKHKNESLTNL